MSTSPNTELLLGCDPQVRVVVIEDGGNLVLQIFSEDPANTDIDALFFNVNDPALIDTLTIYPEFDESTGSNGENVTGFDVATGSLNQMNNGAQIAENYDVRLEFGTVPYSSNGDVDQAMVTMYMDGGDYNLTADDIDFGNMTAVVNTETGHGLALTGGNGGSTPSQTTVTVTTSEDFNHLWHASDSDLVEGWTAWDVRYGELETDGGDDGTLMLQEVQTDGPASLSFDARGINIDRFENSGWGADSLKVEVQIDGGQWVLLDEFAVNDQGTALVGSQTGQTITSHSGEIAYSGGVLDTATENVQFRLVSDISACDEKIRIDNIEIQTTEVVDPAGTKTTIQEENFDGLWDLDHSANVVRDDGWDADHGQARTDGWNDGMLKFAEVAASDPVELTLDMRAENLSQFENDNDWGCSADTLRVEVQIDGGHWVLLDEFQVNDAGTAMVGSETGQTFNGSMTSLSYSGGVLDTASDDVQVRLVSDLSASNERIFVDNVELCTVSGGTPDDETCEDFEAASTGDSGALSFGGVDVTAIREQDKIENGGDGVADDAMVFGTDNPTGGDYDLGFSGQGNAIIISEDGDSSDPDDNWQGGTITFEFEAASDVTSVTLMDIEGNGSSIDLYDTEGELINSIAVTGAGNNTTQEVAINATGVARMEVNLDTSGAVDDLCYSTPEEDCGQYDVTYDDMMANAVTDEEMAVLLGEEESMEDDTEAVLEVA